jgi:hypothetical protein
LAVCHPILDALNTLGALRALNALGATFDTLHALGALRALNALSPALLALDALRTLDSLSPALLSLGALRTLGALHALGTVRARLAALDGLSTLASTTALNFGGLSVFAVRLGTCRGRDRERGNAGCEKYPGHREFSSSHDTTAREARRSFVLSAGLTHLAH